MPPTTSSPREGERPQRSLSNQVETHEAQLKDRSQSLWQTAYSQLDDKDQQILSGYIHRTEIVLDEIVRITEAQYQEYREGAAYKFREYSAKIINATLSVKDIIDTVVAFDPTQHAASAWAIVSFGLTMAKNHKILADVLAECAYIEKNFCSENKSNTGDDPTQPLIKLYKAMLHYAAEIRNNQRGGAGRWIRSCIKAITDQPLTVLENTVNQERDYLLRRLAVGQHLNRAKEAEDILSRIDSLTESMKQLLHQFNLMNLRVAEGAIYNSYLNEHEDFCLPGTRTEVLSEIHKWADSAESRCIFWLQGKAGTGKSTIARTVARSFEEKGSLGATFFFKRGESDRDTARYFISTITKQLVSRHRQLIPDIMETLKNDPNILYKFQSEQFDKLLYRPLEKLHLNYSTIVVIVIDALDECYLENDIKIILKLLSKLEEIRSVPLRVILTSRPEPLIRTGFKDNGGYKGLVLDKRPDSEIKNDIGLFLNHKFAEIRDEYSIHESWPGENKIQELVDMAHPLFIFAATICRFVGDKRWTPEKRLEAILQNTLAISGSRMESTYGPILHQLVSAADDEDATKLLDEFKDIIGVIILLAIPLSVNALASLINKQSVVVHTRLAGFHSVLSVPANSTEDIHSPIRTLHISFRDYLLTAQSDLKIEEEMMHGRIAKHCRQLMSEHLKHNICNLASYGTKRKEIDPVVITQHLTADVQYACQYWVYHLARSQDRISDSEILSFLKKHFLHWLEALAIIGNSELSEFLDDARRFTLQNSSIAGTAPLQIYCSGLVFAPMKSIIKKSFIGEMKRIKTFPVIEDSWSPCLQTFESNSESIRSVAFSSDGLSLASGAFAGIIKIWDTKTGVNQKTFGAHLGVCQQVLEGHSGWVCSVAFSPNKPILASGSRDKTIRLWNLEKKEPLREFKRHSGTIFSVAFSPDGLTLASGSEDKTIRLWNIRTGECQQVLENSASNSACVYLVAFSPNGLTLASGSSDGAIRLWNIRDGNNPQVLEGHSGWVYSVAFSPNESVLASGFDNGTVKLWDTEKGIWKQTLEGHSKFVHSVAFSSDGSFLTSASYDHTIKIWMKERGIYKEVSKDHLNSACSALRRSDLNSPISSSDNWIAVEGENLLWLPAEYRDFVRHAVKDTTLALGYEDGLVLIIGFCTANEPG
ncbi:NACHT and WD40 domain protein [Aspergillus japonicus CBS 114.51]|uniref:Mitochondrial division protein 1 n=1 Tax=Aspergillus japonicus CBS 114.51 TaxID=1448312 RepID=A0A8T8XF85_ASPJA|nr:NACHT and WD40 domain protein [Aspergillus japonicus CBS 114.51]RAH86618.1 NACHT and WD40 domain protein [Aspergillus japonicus CBS 114.51]